MSEWKVIHENFHTKQRVHSARCTHAYITHHSSVSPWRWRKREIIYLSLHCQHQIDFCIKAGSDESHFNVSLIVRDKIMPILISTWQSDFILVIVFAPDVLCERCKTILKSMYWFLNTNKRVSRGKAISSVNNYILRTRFKNCVYFAGGCPNWKPYCHPGTRGSTPWRRSTPTWRHCWPSEGWNLGSAPFTKMVATAESRQDFADHSVNFLKSRGFDGLDLDWEYPANRGSPPEDKDKFTLLVKVRWLDDSHFV